MTSNAYEDYAELIAGAHVERPKFTQWLQAITEPLKTARERLAAMQRQFDVDYAVGDQLDAVGARVGISRNLPMRLTGVYFALDDVEGIGLDRGVWKGKYDPDDGVNSLGDETYRAVIKAKILANSFDGTNGSLPRFLSDVLSYFDVPAKVLDLQDLQTMHVALHLTKDTTPPIVWELFSRRIIDVTAAGVSIAIIDNDPWFGLDYDTASVKGLDEGSFFPFSSLTNSL